MISVSFELVHDLRWFNVGNADISFAATGMVIATENGKRQECVQVSVNLPSMQRFAYWKIGTLWQTLIYRWRQPVYMVIATANGKRQECAPRSLNPPLIEKCTYWKIGTLIHHCWTPSIHGHCDRKWRETVAVVATCFERVWQVF